MMLKHRAHPSGPFANHSFLFETFCDEGHMESLQRLIQGTTSFWGWIWNIPGWPYELFRLILNSIFGRQSLFVCIRGSFDQEKGIGWFWKICIWIIFWPNSSNPFQLIIGWALAAGWIFWNMSKNRLKHQNIACFWCKYTTDFKFYCNFWMGGIYCDTIYVKNSNSNQFVNKQWYTEKIQASKTNFYSCSKKVKNPKQKNYFQINPNILWKFVT